MLSRPQSTYREKTAGNPCGCLQFFAPQYSTQIFMKDPVVNIESKQSG